LAGNGLTFDKVTVALIQQLAAVYVEEDLLAETENLHGSQTTENKYVVEVMVCIDLSRRTRSRFKKPT
jgi:hypothetical protein